MSELTRRLKAVDPNLNIIPGGMRKYSSKADDNWERAAGLNCPKCENEMLRIFDGLCPQCYRIKVLENEKRDEDKSMKRLYSRRLREGTVSLGEMRENRF